MRVDSSQRWYIGSVVALIAALTAGGVQAVPLKLEVVYEASTWQFEPFGLSSAPGPARMTALFDSMNDDDPRPGRHDYPSSDVAMSFAFGIPALDDPAVFDVAFGFTPGTPGVLQFDEADLAGSLHVAFFDALGSGRENNPAGSGSCPTHEYTAILNAVVGRNGGLIRPSDGRFDCRSFIYQATSATLMPQRVPEPTTGGCIVLGIAVLGAMGRRGNPPDGDRLI